MKQTLIIMVFAFAMLPILLLFFAAPKGGALAANAVPILVYAMSGAALIAGILLSGILMRPDLEPNKFQSGMIITMALFELVALFGIFMSNTSNLTALAPFVAASTLADLFIVMPKVLAYWRNRT